MAVFSNPGTNLTYNNRLSRMLQNMDARAGPIKSHPQGLAHMLRMAMAGHYMGKDRREQMAADSAVADAQFAKPWVNPDTNMVAPGTSPDAVAMRNLRGVPGEAASTMTRSLAGNLMARSQARADTLAERQHQAGLLSAANIRADTIRKEEHLNRLAIEAAKLGEGQYRGVAEWAQDRNILLSGDPNSPEYASSYANEAAGKWTQDPETKAWTYTKPDMSMYRVPLYRLPGQAAGAPSLPPKATNAAPPRLPPPPGQPLGATAAAPRVPPLGGPLTSPVPQPPPPTGSDVGTPSRVTTGGRPVPTAAQKAVDTRFAAEYADFIIAGGMADVQKNLAQLSEVVTALESGTDMLTGPAIGAMPDFIRDRVNPQASDTQAAVEEVVQRNLRLILGAQFTEKEGVRLIARAYNPSLEEHINARRVRRLHGAIQKAAQAKLEAAKYYEPNGTLVGYTGSRLFTLKDIEEAAFGDDESSGGSTGFSIEKVN